jgi:hypothetical protein
MWSPVVDFLATSRDQVHYRHTNTKNDTKNDTKKDQ